MSQQVLRRRHASDTQFTGKNSIAYLSTRAVSAARTHARRTQTQHEDTASQPEATHRSRRNTEAAHGTQTTRRLKTSREANKRPKPTRTKDATARPRPRRQPPHPQHPQHPQHHRHHRAGSSSPAPWPRDPPTASSQARDEHAKEPQPQGRPPQTQTRRRHSRHPQQRGANRQKAQTTEPTLRRPTKNRHKPRPVLLFRTSKQKRIKRAECAHTTQATRLRWFHARKHQQTSKQRANVTQPITDTDDTLAHSVRGTSVPPTRPAHRRRQKPTPKGGG